MHIGVDATCWNNTRGYGRHARALLRALIKADDENRYTFFVDSPETSDPLPETAKNHVVAASRPAVQAAAAEGSRSLLDLARMSAALSTAKLDLVFFPTIYSYVPVLTRAKKVVMIHDVIADKFPALTLPSRTARTLWNAKHRLGRAQADAIATVSEYSRKELIRHFDLDPDRVHVVGEASDPVFRPVNDPRWPAGLEVDPARQIVVYVGGFGPHKNLKCLIRAFRALTSEPRFAETQLVMVGEYRNEVFHSEYGELKGLIEGLDLEHQVVFAGYMPDEDLVALLNRARVLVLPSLMEGFGLPAVEAAACGCPVIATQASPLPDLLGAGGLYFDPECQPELEAALKRVLESEALRLEMREAGLAASARLTWEAAARQLLGVLNEVWRRGATA